MIKNKKIRNTSNIIIILFKLIIAFKYCNGVFDVSEKI